jgi:hypothetical protein
MCVDCWQCADILASACAPCLRSAFVQPFANVTLPKVSLYVYRSCTEPRVNWIGNCTASCSLLRPTSC